MAPNTILMRRMICKSHTNRACSRITFKEVILWKLWYWWAGRCLSGPSDSGRWASWTAFSRRKTLPAGGSGRGRPAEKEKFCAGTREKRRDRGKTRGGAQTVFYIVWAPPVFEIGLRPQKQKSLALLYRFSAEDGPGRSQRLQFALPPLLTGSGVGSLNAHFAVPWGCRTCSMRCPPRGSRAGARICSA